MHTRTCSLWSQALLFALEPGAGAPWTLPSWSEPCLPRVLSGKLAAHHLISLPLTHPLRLQDDDRVELFSCQTR